MNDQGYETTSTERSMGRYKRKQNSSLTITKSHLTHVTIVAILLIQIGISAFFYGSSCTPVPGSSSAHQSSNEQNINDELEAGNLTVEGYTQNDMRILVKRNKGDHTPLNPNKKLAVIRLPIDIKGTKIWVHDPKECIYISKGLFEDGQWEPYVQKALMESLPPIRQNDESGGRPSLFVDIGGNIGTFSIIMAAAGYQVEAFEPMEYNVELFAQSILENKLQDKIKLYKVAVGKTYTPKVCLQAFASTDEEPNLGNNKIKEGTPDLGNNCVPLVRPDTIVSRCPDIVKVDVEGLEVNALIGLGVSKNGTCRPKAIAIEEQHGESSKAHLEKLGYNCELLKAANGDWICRIQ